MVASQIFDHAARLASYELAMEASRARSWGQTRV